MFSSWQVEPAIFDTVKDNADGRVKPWFIVTIVVAKANQIVQ